MATEMNFNSFLLFAVIRRGEIDILHEQYPGASIKSIWNKKKAKLTYLLKWFRKKTEKKSFSVRASFVLRESKNFYFLLKRIERLIAMRCGERNQADKHTHKCNTKIVCRRTWNVIWNNEMTDRLLSRYKRIRQR